MGSTLSVPSQLKSYFTGDSGETAGEWTETDEAHVLQVAVTWLRKDDSVKLEVVKCYDAVAFVMKLKISGEIKRLGKKFTKFAELPENARLFYLADVLVCDGYFVVTIPKVEEV